MFRILFFLVAFAPLISVFSVAVIAPESNVIEDLERETGDYKGSPTNGGEWLIGYTLLMAFMYAGYHKKVADFDREKTIQFDLFVSRPEGLRNIDQLMDIIYQEYRYLENENFPNSQTIDEMEIIPSYMNIFNQNLIVIVKCNTKEIGEWFSVHNLTVRNQVVFGHSRKELIKTVRNIDERK